MRRWLVAIWARVAVIAIGRKAPQTLAEQKRIAWAGAPVRYRQTQPGSWWKLRIGRGLARRKVS